MVEPFQGTDRVGFLRLWSPERTRVYPVIRDPGSRQCRKSDTNPVSVVRGEAGWLMFCEQGG